MNETTKTIYQELLAKYNKSSIGKVELSNELGISVSTINYYLNRGINLPNYRKLEGKGNGGRVIFPLQELALFLTHNTRVV